MQLQRRIPRAVPGGATVVVAVGRFDGLHCGHQAVLRVLASHGNRTGAHCVVVLLDWPRRGATAPPSLSTLRQRLEWLSAAGVETVVLARDRAPGALADALPSGLEVNAMVLGAPGRASTAALEARALSLGAAVEVVPTVEIDGVAVSSAIIRSAIAAGDLSRAARLIGRPFEVGGRVVHGHHRGRQIGVPTANVHLRGVQLPPDGVYAVRARVAGRLLDGVSNIGVKPTFGDHERSVETHLLDFQGDLYGQRMALAFVAGLRGERRFPNVDALVEQIHADIVAARQLLARR